MVVKTFISRIKLSLVATLFISNFSCKNKECRKHEEYTFKLPISNSHNSIYYDIDDSLIFTLKFEPTHVLDSKSNKYHDLSNLSFQMTYHLIDITKREDSIMWWPEDIKFLTEGAFFSKAFLKTDNSSRYSLSQLKADSSHIIKITFKIPLSYSGKFLLLASSNNRTNSGNTFPGKCKFVSYIIQLDNENNNSVEEVSNYLKLYSHPDNKYGIYPIIDDYEMRMIINVKD